MSSKHFEALASIVILSSPVSGRATNLWSTERGKSSKISIRLEYIPRVDTQHRATGEPIYPGRTTNLSRSESITSFATCRECFASNWRVSLELMVANEGWKNGDGKRGGIDKEKSEARFVRE